MIETQRRVRFVDSAIGSHYLSASAKSAQKYVCHAMPLKSLLDQISGAHLSQIKDITVGPALGFSVTRLFTSGLLLLDWLNTPEAEKAATPGFNEKIRFASFAPFAKKLPINVISTYSAIRGEVCRDV